MKLDLILDKIGKHQWWIEESPATHQIAEWAWRGFMESSKYFDIPYLSMGIFVYRNDYISEVTPRDEKIKQFYFTLENYKRDKKYIQSRVADWKKIVEVMVSDGWKLLSDADALSRKELSVEYKKFLERYVDQARYTAFIECVDPFTEDILPKILEKELPEKYTKESGNIAAIMSAPEVLSFMEEERVMLLEACLEIKSGKDTIKNKSAELEKKYIWMATHYGSAVPKTAKKFKQEILKIGKSTVEIKKELNSLRNKIVNLKKEKHKIVNKYKLKKEIVKMFDLVGEIGAWIDGRKEYALQGTFIIYHLLEKLERMLKAPKELIAYATYEEIPKWILSDKNKVGSKTLKNRRDFSVYLVERTSKGKSKANFIIGKDAKKIYDEIFKIKNVKEIRGTVASPVKNLVRGKVSIVLNTSTDKFVDGNILVTTMTRPDFLPLMRRAKAIITDEGGLTCHAAIISREMGKPCIIGTKVATRILKNGDFVEMDTKTGIIKILK